MQKTQHKLALQLNITLLTALFAAGLFLFYFKYVPLVTHFQYFLLPLLLCVLFLTVYNLEAGLLFFVFAFPLINSLPYFFGIQGDIPHAPTALVLFLFFFLGFLLRGVAFGHRLNLKPQILKPIGLFASLILISAVITFLRYGQFYPFLSDSIHELSTNIRGVSAGGAIMSVVFSSLNYLSGFAFFTILISVLDSPRFFKRLIGVFCFSAIIALSFGLFQLLFNKELGNSANSIRHGLINGTFKDSLSLSAFIVLVVPLLFALSFRREKLIRLSSIYALLTSLVIIYFTGSKIGLICVVFSLLFFTWILFRIRHKTAGSSAAMKPQMKIGIVVFLILLLISSAIFITAKSDSNSGSSIARIKYMVSEGIVELMYRWRIPLWRGAISMMVDYPFSGVGVGAYIIEIANYEQSFHRNEAAQSAENYFLQVGAETGLLGLILIFIIFAKIASAAKRQLFETQNKDSFKLLQAGVGVSLCAYFVILLFHTYIGSFEVKYVFWLLAAIVFTRLDKKISFPKKNKGGKTFKAAALLAMVFFGVSLFWNSTHSLSLEHRTKEFSLMHYFGFYAQEEIPGVDIFQWTKKTAGRSVKVEKPILSMSLHASHPDISTRPVQLRISLIQDSFKTKVILDTLEIKNSDWQDLKYDLSAYMGQIVIVIFEVSRTWNPQKVQGSSDSRDLGIALKDFACEDAGT